MNIGKREQLVIGGVITIALIGLLHVFIFSPNASAYRDTKTKYQALIQSIKSLKTTNTGELDSYNAVTQKYLTEIKDGLSILRVDEATTFSIPTPDEIKAELKKANIITPKMTDLDAANQVNIRLDEIKKTKERQQIDILISEVNRLKGFVNSTEPVMSFLGKGGWALPTDLPQIAKTAQLWDILTRIANMKGVLARLSQGADYNQYKESYDAYLKQLGLDEKFADENLAQFGEFVPLYYKLAIADMIYQLTSNEAKTIEGRILTREYLFEILSVDIPFVQIQGIKETKIYFAYEMLNNLNNLLDMAKEYKIKEVSRVELGAFGFLRQLTSLGDPNLAIVNPAELPSDDGESVASAAASSKTAAAATTRAPGAKPSPVPRELVSPETMQAYNDAMKAWKVAQMEKIRATMPTMMRPGSTPTPVAEKKTEEKLIEGGLKPDEIGMALPVKLTVISDNMNLWNFMYEVLRRQPMAEMDRLILKSQSVTNQDDLNIQGTVTFIMVPKLFGTLDAVRQAIEQIKDKEDKPQSEAQATAPEAKTPVQPPAPKPVAP